MREIQTGGQRIVYEVLVGDERRALKLMPAAARNRAEREVALGRTCEHPNLVRILDDELSDVEVGGRSWVYFTETFIDGVSLAERGTGMEPCVALRMARDLTGAIEYLWERKVVHRDIKPANIMETPDGRFVLLDVGIGRHQERSTITVVAGEHGPGTTGYLSPEQLQPLKGRELDYRSDLFLVGIVMYEQLIGTLPFDPTAVSYRTLLTTGVTSGLDRFPEALAGLLRRLLAPRPHGRYRLDKAQAAIAAVSKELGCS